MQKTLLVFRSTLFFLFLIFYTAPYAIACFIVFPFVNRKKRYRFALGWIHSIVKVAKWLCKINYQIIGFENLPTTPAVILSKHQSAWETVALPALMPRPLCFVFKKELLYVPFFGWVLGMLSMVHIDRRHGKKSFGSIVAQGKKRLADGAWVTMFPEGTRTAVGSKPFYKTGGVRFAIATGAPIIPIAHNAGRVWPRNSFLKYPGLVTVSIGKTIQTAGLSIEEVNKQVENWIETEMRKIDPAAYEMEKSSAN